jgi:hypothetical protein
MMYFLVERRLSRLSEAAVETQHFQSYADSSDFETSGAGKTRLKLVKSGMFDH